MWKHAARARWVEAWCTALVVIGAYSVVAGCDHEHPQWRIAARDRFRATGGDDACVAWPSDHYGCEAAVPGLWTSTGREVLIKLTLSPCGQTRRGGSEPTQSSDADNEPLTVTHVVIRNQER